ncbi:hypothetical protein F5B20DRAFT_437945 [Whalleya microplaca]|nr:hypothetical protein F5B20DRAFT_437945 [Whalleya microplaca]
MKKILLLCFIHGFQGGEDTFGSNSEFAQHLAAIVSTALPRVEVRAITYPKYETRGDLYECVSRFRDWLLEKVIDLEVANGTPSPTVDPSVHTILIGHSMGGIVAAETAIALSTEQPIKAHESDEHDARIPRFNALMFPYVQGVLAFDTPYLGISPGVVAHGAEGQYKNAAAAFTQLSGLTGMLFGASKAASGSNSSTAGNQQQAKKPVAALPASPPLTRENMEQQQNPQRARSNSNASKPNMPPRARSSSTAPNPNMPPRARSSSTAPNPNVSRTRSSSTAPNPNAPRPRSNSTASKQSVPPRARSSSTAPQPNMSPRARSGSTTPNPNMPPRTRSNSTAPIPNVPRPRSNSNAPNPNVPRPRSNSTASKPNSPRDRSSSSGGWGWGTIAMVAGAAGAVAAGSAAAYMNREQISEGWSWVGSHLEFVSCLGRGEELRARVANMVRLNKELGVGFANLYTRLGKAAASKQVSMVGTVMGNERTFCNLPSKQAAGLWREAVNDKAKDETGAHMNMFEPKENPGYTQLSEDARSLIVTWARTEWYESSYREIE